MYIGYARVSTLDQQLDLQIDALTAAGCEKIFKDCISGSQTERDGLQEVLDYVRAGDTLVIWRLDRLGRSLSDLIARVGWLQEKQVHVKSLHESIETSSSSGKLIFHVFGALAEFERDLIRERTVAGLNAARARGRLGGRPKSLSATQEKMLLSMYSDKNISVQEICETLEISRSTLYKYMKDLKTNVPT